MIKRMATLACIVILSMALAGCAGSDGAPAGGVETIRVSANGTFSPDRVAPAGTPLRLEFGPGSGCTAAIKFPERGIFEDLTDGGGVVELPALTAGQYPLICQSDMVMGTLTVE